MDAEHGGFLSHSLGWAEPLENQTKELTFGLPSYSQALNVQAQKGIPKFSQYSIWLEFVNRCETGAICGGSLARRVLGRC